MCLVDSPYIVIHAQIYSHVYPAYTLLYIHQHRPYTSTQTVYILCSSGTRVTHPRDLLSSHAPRRRSATTRTTLSSLPINSWHLPTIFFLDSCETEQHRTHTEPPQIAPVLSCHENIGPDCFRLKLPSITVRSSPKCRSFFSTMAHARQAGCYTPANSCHGSSLSSSLPQTTPPPPNPFEPRDCPGRSACHVSSRR